MVTAAPVTQGLTETAPVHARPAGSTAQLLLKQHGFELQGPLL